jgi:hypothetical protein
MSRSLVLPPQDAKCTPRAPPTGYNVVLLCSDSTPVVFVTQCSSLLLVKKNEGSLTAREAAMLIVSEELGCVATSSLVA